MGLESFFTGKNIREHEGTKGGKYFSDGSYLVKVIECKMIDRRSGQPAFVADLEVIESNNEETKVGDKCGFFVGMDKDPAMGKIADFMKTAYTSLANAAGHADFNADNDLTDEDANNAINGNNSLMGVYLSLYCFKKEVKSKPGNFFTAHQWSVPSNVAELVSAA